MPAQTPGRILREALTLLGLLVATAIPSFFWHQLPARVAIHFDLHGTPNGYGSRGSLFLLPAIAALVYALLHVIAHFPQSFNLPVPRSSPARPCYERVTVDLLGWLRLELVWSFALIEWMIVRAALGEQLLHWSFLLPLQIVIIACTVFFYLARARRICGGS